MIRRLDGRSALITGASQGLGLEIAHAYVAAGAKVMMCARDAVHLERARVEVAALSTGRQQVLGRPGDISKPAQAQELAAEALAAFPRLEILVNNAGAAALAVFLGSADSDGITGELLSATWDLWETLAAHRQDLQDTDVYTLRRVVPADRSLSWGRL